MKTAILAGGCYWGVEHLFRRLPGIIDTQVGFTGGHVDNPTYEMVCTKTTGHAEAIKITYDPEQVTFRQLLELFFQIHDPTTVNRQGNDIGDSYRSEIFYTDEDQRAEAEQTIKDVDASGLWPGKVVTKISPAVRFWDAPESHQDYLEKNPNGYNCHFPRADWVLPRT